MEKSKPNQDSIRENPLAHVDFELDLDTAALIIAFDAYPGNEFEQGQCFTTIIANCPESFDREKALIFLEFIEWLRREGITNWYYQRISQELRDAIRSMKNEPMLRQIDVARMLAGDNASENKVNAAKVRVFRAVKCSELRKLAAGIPKPYAELWLSSQVSPNEKGDGEDPFIVGPKGNFDESNEFE